MYPLVRPFMFAFDAERAHGLALDRVHHPNPSSKEEGLISPRFRPHSQTRFAG